MVARGGGVVARLPPLAPRQGSGCLQAASLSSLDPHLSLLPLTPPLFPAPNPRPRAPIPPYPESKVARRGQPRHGVGPPSAS